jgi:allatostatin A receptor
VKAQNNTHSEKAKIIMFGEVCSNFTHTFKWDNETYVFDHELECTVSRTVFVLFSFIGVAGLVGNALVVLGEYSLYLPWITNVNVILLKLTVVAANPMMRSTTNILIINLAVADLLFVIFCKYFLTIIITHMKAGIIFLLDENIEKTS